MALSTGIVIGGPAMSLWHAILLGALRPPLKLVLMPSQPHLTLLSVWVVAVLAQPGTGAAVPPSNAVEERAVAITSPSLIYVEAHMDGFLQDKKTGKRLHASPVTVVTRCSGFAVGADGFAVTATRCLLPSPGALRGSAAYTLANLMIRDKQLAPEKKDEYTRQLIEKAEFVGSSGTQSMEPRVFGQLFQAFGGLTTVPAVAGRIVDFRPATAADVALLKFDTNLPVAELSTEPLDQNSSVVLIGFSTADAVPEAASYSIRSIPAHVTGHYDAKERMYKLDADIGRFSRGGMVVDASGRVVGMINADTHAQGDPNRVVSDLTTIRELMNSAGVPNTLSTTDQTFRSGLDAYFAGRYLEAIDKLGAVITAAPSHTIAQSYRDQATERLRNKSKQQGGLPSWVLLLIATLAVALVVLATLIVIVIIRNRRRTKEVGGPYYLPNVGGPVSVYPTSGSGLDVHDDALTEYPANWHALPPQPPPVQSESSATRPPESKVIDEN